MFQLTHKKKPARTATSVMKPKALLQLQALSQAPGENRPLALDLEDCEPSVEPEDSGKGGVGVEVESEYDPELRISDNVGRRGMGHSSLLTVQSVRW